MSRSGRRRFSALSGLTALIMAMAMASGAGAQHPATASDYRLGSFTLPQPGGSYPIGSRSFELARADGTALGIVAWYPAMPGNTPRTPYMTPDEQRTTLPALTRIFGWPATTLDGLSLLKTHAHTDAPIARGRFPVVIFSHGFLLYPRQNTALMERLAAAGYIIFSVSHPGDAADLPSLRGLLATTLRPAEPDPDPKAIEAYWNAPDQYSQIKLLPAFWRAPSVRYMTARLAIWREDLRLVTRAIARRQVPNTARSIAAAARADRIAYVGMSFGGSSSVSQCKHERRCRAAVNLDGIEFDRTLYNRAIGKPVLLIQSDWRNHPNAGRPPRLFTSYDYAYEAWAKAGLARDVHRFSIEGLRHLGFSDLILAPRDAFRDATFGTTDGEAAIAVVNDMVVAFLDRYLVSRKADLFATAARHANLKHHSAAGLRNLGKE